jgi:NAD(P)-dependent dehydrogenase (short-subunit alcohol dehydrogenase family)
LKKVLPPSICLGRIIQISSGAAPTFVQKCNQKIQSFFLNKNVTWSVIENNIIIPFLKISEDAFLDDEQKSVALTKIGLAMVDTDAEMTAYGISKACVYAYTLELARRFPTLMINSCRRSSFCQLSTNGRSSGRH